MSDVVSSRRHFWWWPVMLVVVALLALPLLILNIQTGTSPNLLKSNTPSVLGDSFEGVQVMADNGPDVWVLGADAVDEVNSSSGAVNWVAQGALYDLNAPAAMAYDGSDLWIADSGSNAVTEINASTGDLVRVVKGAAFDLSDPSAIASGGGNVWVSNFNQNSFTEINASTGELVRIVHRANYDDRFSDVAAYADGHVWFAGIDAAVTVINASTGALIEVTNPSKTGAVFRRSIAVCGPHVWVTSVRALDEFSSSTGDLVRAVKPVGHVIPLEVACSGDHLWVSSASLKSPSTTITELSAITGALIKVEPGKRNGLAVLAIGSNRLWIANSDRDALTEYDASTGAFKKVVRGTYYDFNDPQAMAYDGKIVWVANGGNSVSEIDSTTGEPIKVISGAAYKFNEPSSIVFDGKHIWVGSENRDTVTEINASTGALVRIVHSAGYGGVAALATDGRHIWIKNLPYDEISELNTSSGATIRVIHEPDNNGADYSGMIYAGGHLWVVDLARLSNSLHIEDSVSELDPTTNQVVRVLKARPRTYRGYTDLSYDAGHLWVLGSCCTTTGNSVTEFNASTGALMRVMSGATYGFYDPGAIAAKGEYVWVANVGGSCDACNFPGEGTTITVINSSNGALVKVLGDWSYEFDGPSAFTFEGRQLWVANSAGNTVTVVPVH